MHFMDHRNLPAGCKAAYLRIVAAIKLHKVKTHPIRFTDGGNRIDYKGKVSTPTANLQTIKILLNSTVATPDAKMLTATIESFTSARLWIATNICASRHLALSNYTPVKHTPGRFRHATRPVAFFLVVDNFAIKYVDGVNAKHLLATLRSLYNITMDWTASMYCGITLK